MYRASHCDALEQRTASAANPPCVSAFSLAATCHWGHALCFLRLAESMSPVLTIPGGVKVNAKITGGFFIGEVGTHRKIKAARNASKQKGVTRPVNNKETINNGSDDGWK